MTTLLERNEIDAPTHPAQRPDDFAVVESDQALGRNLPQRMGGALWAPMLAMALMAFPVGLALGIYRASLVAGGGGAAAVAQLGHYTAAAVFVGFLAVLSAITFAIARILGVFRSGGGAVQQTAGVRVQTLKLPATAKAMLAGMMMGMMLIAAAVVLHVVAAATISPVDLTASEQWFHVLEGVRRLGIAIYLLAIAVGLGTIIRVLRFQSVRIREVADRAADPG